MEFSISEKTLHFKKPARTSRGEYTEHRMLVIRLSEGSSFGLGECAPLPDLSCDRDAYGDILKISGLIGDIISENDIEGAISERLKELPALRFAMESALAQLYRKPVLYDTQFARSEAGIPINGLVWMADYKRMLEQVKEKIASGYKCIKLKIGAINWDEEISLIRFIRSQFSEEDLQLRVDANGAFSQSEVMQRLEELSRYGIHSIEQPVRQGQWELMAQLCRNTPVPIALDEELIGVNDSASKKDLLDFIRPQFIVVKPTLHGGLSGASEWISEASSRGIKSWITSALESNIGLKSIALLAASIYGSSPEMMPQGLGTGLLFTDNINTGVYIKDGFVWIS